MDSGGFEREFRWNYAYGSTDLLPPGFRVRITGVAEIPEVYGADASNVQSVEVRVKGDNTSFPLDLEDEWADLKFPFEQIPSTIQIAEEGFSFLIPDHYSIKVVSFEMSDRTSYGYDRVPDTATVYVTLEIENLSGYDMTPRNDAPVRIVGFDSRGYIRQEGGLSFRDVEHIAGIWDLFADTLPPGRTGTGRFLLSPAFPFAVEEVGPVWVLISTAGQSALFKVGD